MILPSCCQLGSTIWCKHCLYPITLVGTGASISLDVCPLVLWGPIWDRKCTVLMVRLLRAPRELPIFILTCRTQSMWWYTSEYQKKATAKNSLTVITFSFMSFSPSNRLFCDFSLQRNWKLSKNRVATTSVSRGPAMQKLVVGVMSLVLYGTYMKLKMLTVFGIF